MKKIKPTKPSRETLERKVIELTAQLASSYHFASATLPKAKDLMGSGVLVQLTALGGKELINPVVIQNGLSEATIEALMNDIRRSYNYATELKPKGE